MKFNAKEYWENRAEEWLKSTHWNADEAKLLLKYLSELKHLKTAVEFGCGNAPFAHLFNIMNFSYIGTDISKKMIDECKRMNRMEDGYFFVDSLQDTKRTGDVFFCRRSLMNVPTEEIAAVVKKLKKHFEYGIIIDFREDVNKEGEAKQSQYHDFSKFFNIIFEDNIQNLNKMMLVGCK